MQLRKRYGSASTLVPSKRRRSQFKASGASTTKNSIHLPTENVSDVFQALDRASLEALQLVCRRYRHLIDSALADVCLREIRHGSIRRGVDNVRPLGRKRPHDVCSAAFYTARTSLRFSDFASKCIRRFAAALRHSVVVTELCIENVDGAYAFELAKQLSLNCRNTRIIGALLMSNLKTLAHFRHESVMSAFAEMVTLRLRFNEDHHTHCDSILRYCAEAGICDVQISQLFQDRRFGAIRPALSEDAVIAYCLHEGTEKRELCVPGHHSRRRSLACTAFWECKLIATCITPQVTTDFAEYEQETSDDHRYFEFPDAAVPFIVLLEAMGDDVNLTFARLSD